MALLALTQQHLVLVSHGVQAVHEDDLVCSIVANGMFDLPTPWLVSCRSTSD